MGFIEKTRQFLRGTPQQSQRTSFSFLNRARRSRAKGGDTAAASLTTRAPAKSGDETAASSTGRAPAKGGDEATASSTGRQPSGKEKKYTRSEFKGLLKGAWKDSRLSPQERTGLEKNLFPYQKYGTQISEKDVRSVLQKLRKDEFWAKTYTEKEKIGRQRKTLEEAAGFKGKY